MADNLKYNEPGSGPFVATDDVGSQHFQKFKLDVGGDGASLGVAGSVPVYIVSGTGSYLMNDPFVDSVAIAGQLDDTGTTAATENNVAPLRITAQRAAHVNLRNTSGTEVGTNATPLAFSGTVQGFTAADLPATSYPILLGAIAEVAGDSQPSNLVDAEGDVVRLAAGRDGAIYTKPHPPRIWHYSQEFNTKMTDYVIKSGVANLSLYIGTIYFVASGVVNAFLKDGTAAGSAVKWKYYAGGLGDGVAIQFNPPLKLSVNTDLGYTSTTTTYTFLTISGYTAP